ncbi:MAG: tRNA (N6-threonylcarbamoyladenosine(37)-N6)-methyltransferase TrmO [candidate division Zixibacteria bacterium]|nr:tRNA (N6-threonylcarbamoyladenosine(37)-N6)-methyltransferase TrmO [candidate division Zixibacteria bacterium]
MQKITLTQIGIIHTPFVEPQGTPIQPQRSGEAKGTIEVFPEFVAGLADLDGFSHIILLYFMHLTDGFKLAVTPFLDDHPRGLFATRAPRRPSPIGLSVVRLEQIDGQELCIREVDMVDGTPLLDIKPYIPRFDDVSDIRIGWLEGKAKRAENHRADDRFRS